MRMLQEAGRWLRGLGVGRRGWLVVLGVVLVLPTLSNRLVLDDLMLMNRLAAGSSARGLFTFATGVPAEVRRAMEVGDLFPWWTSPELTVSFFRPLSALSHGIDAALWPRSAWLMQAHSLAIYALLLVVVAALYASVARTPAAGSTSRSALFALTLFVLDDAHGATLSWLANRNALLTTLLGAAALWSHHRHRALGWRPGAVLAPALLGAALLAGEAAVATLGYLAAYTICLEPKVADRGQLRRWLSLAPCMAMAVVWQIAYRLFHHGVSSSGVYADPAQAPAAFLRGLARNGLALAGAELGVTSADLLVWGPPGFAPFVLGAAALGLVALAAAALPVLRARPAARFWAIGALLALVPISAGLPGDRLLLFVSVGAMGLLGETVDWHLDRHLLRWRARPDARLPRAERALGLVWLGLLSRRTIFALALLPIRTHAMQPFAAGADAADAAIQRYGAHADTVIFLNAPIAPDVSYLAARWAFFHRPTPPRVLWLASNPDGVRVTRTAPNTLRVAPEGGFLGHSTDRLYRDSQRPFAPGQAIQLAGLTAHIVTVTGDGRPAVVDFIFSDDLQRRGRLWLTWQDGHYQPFPFPRAGESAVFSPAKTLTLSLAVHSPEAVPGGN